MKTAELTGIVLDWAVGYVMGEKLRILERQIVWPEDYSPSTNWAQGGPIIEREEIELKVLANCLDTDDHPTFKPGDAWEANLWPADKDLIEYCGPTPLVAAMRCYVAIKLGDTVDIPEELK